MLHSVYHALHSIAAYFSKVLSAVLKKKMKKINKKKSFRSVPITFSNQIFDNTQTKYRV